MKEATFVKLSLNFNILISRGKSVIHKKGWNLKAKMLVPSLSVVRDAYKDTFSMAHSEKIQFRFYFNSCFRLACLKVLIIEVLVILNLVWFEFSYATLAVDMLMRNQNLFLWWWVFVLHQTHIDRERERKKEESKWDR